MVNEGPTMKLMQELAQQRSARAGYGGSSMAQQQEAYRLLAAALEMQLKPILQQLGRTSLQRADVAKCVQVFVCSYSAS